MLAPLFCLALVQKDIGGLEDEFGSTAFGGDEHRLADFYGGKFAKAELCFGTTE
jgi:hypothetical protein